MKPTVIYYRWSYSPTTGDVTLAHNHEGHPADIRFHSDMARERPESDLLHGFAHRTATDWTVHDADSRVVDDPHVVASVLKAIQGHEGLVKQAEQMSMGLGKPPSSAFPSYEPGSYTLDQQNREQGGWPTKDENEEYQEYHEGAEEKWAWIEGQQPRYWSDSELGDGDPYSYDSQGNTRRDEYGDAIQNEDEGITAHFEVLVQMAMADPEIQHSPAMKKMEGVNYRGLDYSNVAAVLNEYQKKWAVGTRGYFSGGQGLSVGAHGPTTTAADVEAATHESVVYANPGQQTYGLKKWQQQADDEDLWNDEGTFS